MKEAKEAAKNFIEKSQPTRPPGATARSRRLLGPLAASAPEPGKLTTLFALLRRLVWWPAFVAWGCSGALAGLGGVWGDREVNPACGIMAARALRQPGR